MYQIIAFETVEARTRTYDSGIRCTGEGMLVQARVTNVYYTTKTVTGPITKINQSECSVAGPIFSVYLALYRMIPRDPPAGRSRVINLLLTKLVQAHTGRISALSLFCTFRTVNTPRGSIRYRPFILLNSSTQKFKNA